MTYVRPAMALVLLEKQSTLTHEDRETVLNIVPVTTRPCNFFGEARWTGKASIAGDASETRGRGARIDAANLTFDAGSRAVRVRHG